MPSLLLLLTFAAIAPPAAAPDFSQSAMTMEPATVVEGDVVTFHVRLRNTGDEDAPYTELQVDLPLEAMFVDLTGLEQADIDPIAKVIEATINLPAGGERTFHFRMVVPRDAGGRLLSPRLRARYLYRGVEFNAGEPIQIDTRISTSGVAFGGVRFNSATLAVLGVLALYPALRVLTRARVRSAAPSLAITVAVGFWLLFAAMARDDWRTVTAFRQTTCTIVDSRMRVETETSRVPRSRLMPAATNTTYKPLLALRYQADGREVISTGYDSSSRLSIGGAARAGREYAQWKVGGQVPCWYDPDDVGRVLVIPGFGGAYFFALFPVPLFAYAVWALVTRES